MLTKIYIFGKFPIVFFFFELCLRGGHLLFAIIFEIASHKIILDYILWTDLYDQSIQYRILIVIKKVMI